MKVSEISKKIKIKRAYDSIAKDDGTRILVDRLWPRGIKKIDLKLDLWLKEIAPSTNLRKWYSHDPKNWMEFQKKYGEELDHNLNALKPVIESLKKGVVTLVYAARDTEHNHALFLKHYIEKHIQNS